jgi:hypothetical protein
VTTRRLHLAAVCVALVASAAGCGAEPVVEDTAWNAAIHPLASFVEKEYGVSFAHPVRVSLLSDHDFDVATGVQRVTSCTAKCEEATHAAASLDSLVGIPTETPKPGPQDTAKGTTLLGVYVPGSQTLLVRGKEITERNQPIIVHELTHALQDQRQPKLPADVRDPERLLGWSSLVEADATRIERRWRDDHRDAAADTETATSPAAPTTVVEAVGYLRALFPYIFGSSFLSAALTSRSIGDIYANPPASSAAVLSGATSTPAVAEGIGGVRWMAALALRNDALTTRRAVGAIVADQLTSRDQNRCATDTIHTTDRNGTVLVAAALASWARGVGAQAPRVSDTQITVTLCERYGTTPNSLTPAALLDRYQVMIVRDEIVSRLLAGGHASAARAQCAADGALVTVKMNPDAVDLDSINAALAACPG